jgi:plastocyanin
MSSLKQILASTFLITSSLLVKADYSSGSGSGGYGDNYGSSSGYGSGGSSSGYDYGNQGNEASSSWGDGYGGGGMGGGGYTDSWDQSSTALYQTITYTMTETSMATTTVTESCSTTESWPYSSSESWSGSSPMWSPANSVSVQIVHVSDNNGTLAYSPESITAEPGSIVEFIFYPKVHS